LNEIPGKEGPTLVMTHRDTVSSIESAQAEGG
jgi:hypothetical protein